MKGMVFTEFVELVEDKFSPDLADQLFDECDLPSGGAYTSVGSYDHAEIVELVAKLSEKTDIPVKHLIIAFGQHLIERFSEAYPDMFAEQDLFKFLQSIHGHVHVEVRKLYPDAELPDLSVSIDENVLTMKYSSSRPFSHLAYGLITGAVEHFGEQIEVTRSHKDGGLYESETFMLKRIVN